MLTAELAVIDNYKDAQTLCDQLISYCQTYRDISALVPITLILERIPLGITLENKIDHHPNPPNFRLAMRDHLFREWQTATRLRMTQAVCDEAIRELTRLFAIAGITPIQSDPRIAIAIRMNNL